MLPILSANIDEKEMHTLRISVMWFKKAWGKLLIKHSYHKSINHHVFIISLFQLLSICYLRLAFTGIA